MNYLSKDAVEYRLRNSGAPLTAHEVRALLTSLTDRITALENGNGKTSEQQMEVTGKNPGDTAKLKARVTKTRKRASAEPSDAVSAGD